MPRVIQPLGGDGELRVSMNLFVLLDEPSLLTQNTVWAQLNTHTVYATCPQDTFPSEVYYILFLKASCQLPPPHTQCPVQENLLKITCCIMTKPFSLKLTLQFIMKLLSGTMVKEGYTERPICKWDIQLGYFVIRPSWYCTGGRSRGQACECFLTALEQPITAKRGTKEVQSRTPPACEDSGRTKGNVKLVLHFCRVFALETRVGTEWVEPLEGRSMCLCRCVFTFISVGGWVGALWDYVMYVWMCSHVYKR